MKHHGLSIGYRLGTSKRWLTAHWDWIFIAIIALCLGLVIVEIWWGIFTGDGTIDRFDSGKCGALREAC